MGFLQQVKQGKLTPTEAKKQLIAKAARNGEESYARRSKTFEKLTRLEEATTK